MATKSKKTSDVYVLNTDGTLAVERNVSKPDLSKLQKLVGGLIEAVYGTGLPRGVDVWANEEGLCLGMAFNHRAHASLGRELVGPVVVVDNRSDRSKALF